MDAALAQRIKQDLQTVVVDAEELLKATAGQTGERIDKLRTRAEESLIAARLRLVEAGAAAGETARAAARNADDQAHRHPYALAGLAAGVGLLVGLLIGRR